MTRPPSSSSSGFSQTTVIVLLALLLSGSLAFVGWAVYDSFKGDDVVPVVTTAEEEEAEEVVPPPPPPPDPRYYCTLDGTAYDDRGPTRKRPIVIQVDNAPAARPQIGLGRADIVYEAMAEGQVTRFSAVFGCRDAETGGPVRSARLIDLELVPEYQALLADSGASIGVTNELAAAPDVPRINHGAYPAAYWRVGDRAAPHNLMTSTILLRQVAAEAGIPIEVEVGDGPAFKDDSPAPGNIRHIAVPYSPWAQVSYDYDPGSNSWLRSMQGKPHLDAETGRQLAAKNVIVQYVPSYDSNIIEDASGDRGLIFDLTGSGRVLVFRDGEVIGGTWSRPGSSAVTTYMDDAGRTIPLDRGPTWIQLVPTEFTAVSWN